MIAINNLIAGYGKTTVLNGLSASVAPGIVAGVVGLNGAGKTTFFNTIARLVKPHGGEITLGGKSVSAQDTGYLEAVNYFYPLLTGREYLHIFKNTNPSFDLSALQQYLKLPLDELIETYSTGMKKKLALLGMLKQDKPVYLLDEPFNGLDLETNKILELIITVLKEKHKIIFISSHILDPLLNVCDVIYHLDKGAFAHTFTKNEFGAIEQALFGDMKEQARKIISKAV